MITVDDDKLKIFGRSYDISDAYDVKKIIMDLANVERALKKHKKILFENNKLCIPFQEYDSYIWADMISQAVQNCKENLPYHKKLENLFCGKEKFQSAKKNAFGEFNYWYYVKIKPDIITAWLKAIATYRTILEMKKEQIEDDRERLKREYKACKSKWTRGKVYKFVKPTGGETTGHDGYMDADYSNGTETIRMVYCDVFDFGCYGYPKRFENTDNVFDRSSWLPEEKELVKWLSKYGPFSGIRM